MEGSFDSSRSSNPHRFSTSEIVPSKRLDSKLHQSLDVSAMRTKADTFGLSFYRPPNNDYMWKHGPAHKISRAKMNTFLDQHSQSLKHVPCSSKYSKLAIWGDRYTGKFRRTKKITISQLIMDRSAKIPAPNQYQTAIKRKIHGSYKM